MKILLQWQTNPRRRGSTWVTWWTKPNPTTALLIAEHAASSGHTAVASESALAALVAAVAIAAAGLGALAVPGSSRTVAAAAAEYLHQRTGTD